MALRTVKPGELITAEDWNTLVNKWLDLDTRVAQLESGGAKLPPRITQVLPTGVRMEGDEIRIYGSNFGFSEGAHSVYFGSTRAVGFLSGSSNTLLIVQIPNKVAEATDSGASLTMSVGNLYGFSTWAITIKKKPEILAGGVDFTYIGSVPTTPTQNVPIRYNFTLHSTASQDLNIAIEADIQVIPPLPAGVPDPGLGGLVTVIDDDGSEQPEGIIALAEGATKTIGVRLNLPNNVNGLKYSMSVTADAEGIVPQVESLPDQQVGQAGEQPDATVTAFEFSSVIEGQGVFSSDTGGISGVDGTLTVKRGTTATIELNTTFAGIPGGTTNHYQISATVLTPTNGWSASVNSVMQNPLVITGPGGSTDTYFDIVAPATSATSIVKLLLTRTDVSVGNKRSVSYRLLTSV